jgi:glycosyltransferase involved in cell wall biosynthesis
MRKHIPLPALQMPFVNVDGSSVHRPADSHSPLAVAPPSPLPATRVEVAPSLPLVSCIMPTRGRPDFVRQSVMYFARQDYPERELIIVDEAAPGASQAACALPAYELPDTGMPVRYLLAPAGESIGDKRNRAIAQARGSFIAQWDDDDWYAPNRLSAQMAPLLARQADITGLKAGIFFDLPRWAFWTCTPALHRRLFFGDVHGGTLVYRKAIWEQGVRYPNRSIAEDAMFLREAMRRGARLLALANDGLYVYLRHESNSWAFECGRYLDPAGWQRAGEPPLPASDLAFYRTLSRSAERSSAASGMPDVAPKGAPMEPFVSCIMPTANRRAFVPHAIRHFQRQSYPRRELIIVDDGSDPIADLVPADPAIRTLTLDRRRSIGGKRNLACDLARGDIILHWDDDDWMASWRIAYQVEQLLAVGSDANGLARLYYYDLERGEPWLYHYPKSRRTWVAGATLCYRRALWQRAPFPEIDVGEDTRFVWSGALQAIEPLPNSDFYVALIHGGNTAPKVRRAPYWSTFSGDLHALTGGELAAYQARRDQVMAR